MAQTNSFESLADTLVVSLATPPSAQSTATLVPQATGEEPECPFGGCSLPDVEALHQTQKTIQRLMARAASWPPAVQNTVRIVLEEELEDIEDGLQEASSALEAFHVLLEDRRASLDPLQVITAHSQYVAGEVPSVATIPYDPTLAQALILRQRQSRSNRRVRMFQRPATEAASSLSMAMDLADYRLAEDLTKERNLTEVVSRYTFRLTESRLHDIYARALPDPGDDVYDRSMPSGLVAEWYKTVRSITENSLNQLSKHPKDPAAFLVSLGTHLGVNKTPLSQEGKESFEDTLKGYCRLAGPMGNQSAEQWIHKVWRVATSGASLPTETPSRPRSMLQGLSNLARNLTGL